MAPCPVKIGNGYGPLLNSKKAIKVEKADKFDKDISVVTDTNSVFNGAVMLYNSRNYQYNMLFKKQIPIIFNLLRYEYITGECLQAPLSLHLK